MTIDTTMMRVSSINLDAVRMRAMHTYKWDVNKAAEVELAYRRFLALIAYVPVSQSAGLAPPSNDVDLMWHEHILHTYEYAAACDLIRGRFIHHVPKADSDKPEEGSLAATVNLFLRYFGEAPKLDADVRCNLNCDPRCKAKCNSQCHTCHTGCRSGHASPP